MAVEVRKQDRESSQSLAYRFSTRIKRSGVLLRAREIKFRRRSKSEQMKKRAALRREELKKKYQALEKLGK